jgi:hypothetical protein
VEEPRKYRKKPVVIEAMRFEDAASARAIQMWAGPGVVTYYPNGAGLHAGPPVLVIRTPTGPSTANVGDWVGHQIVAGRDDFWPIEGGIFEQTYEPAPVDMKVFGRRAG